MSFNEMFTLILYLMRPLVPYIIVLLAVTVLMFTLILYLGRNLWTDNKHFKTIGIFFHLTPTLAVKMGCAWLKLCLLFIYVFGFRPLDLIHYIAFGVLCIFTIIINKNIMEMVNQALSVSIQFAGIVASNILFSYIVQFDVSVSYVVAYAIIGILVLLYSLYVFISEIEYISNERRVKFEEVSEE